MGIHKTQTQSAVIESIDFLCVDSEKNNQNAKEFLSYLSQDVEPSQSFEASVDDDEKFETAINETNAIYRCVKRKLSESSSTDTDNDDQDEELIMQSGYLKDRFYLEPLKNSYLLSYNMLDENEVYVFDFGSELYVWSGRNSSNSLKKAAMELAKELYNKGYDYTSFSLSPIKPRVLPGEYTTNKNEDINFKTNNKRPEWTLLSRQIQNMETILFKEKFVDWPSQRNSPTLRKNNYNPLNKHGEVNGSANERIPVSKTVSSGSTVSSPRVFDYEPVSDRDLRQVISENSAENGPVNNPVNLVLESTNLGRGDHWFDSIERRSFDIITDKVNMFKLVDNQLSECERAEFGQLSEKFTYLIKWQYKVNAVGFRTLKGDLSQHHLVTGRDRNALFFWQGEKASSSEKGTSALLSLDLVNLNSIENLAASLGSSDGSSDKRLIPHVQVFQFKEMAAFCGLFAGRMCILRDSDEKYDEKWRMFELRGEMEKEAHLIQIERVKPDSLRTKTSFLFVNPSKNSIIVWHGFHCDTNHRKLMSSCANNIMKK